MEQHQYDNLLEQLDTLIDLMLEHEGELYLVLETAHQLRDELVQVEPEEPTDNE